MPPNWNRLTVKNCSTRGHPFTIQSNGVPNPKLSNESRRSTFGKYFRKLGTTSNSFHSQVITETQNSIARRSQSISDIFMTSCAERRAYGTNILETDAHDRRVDKDTKKFKMIRQPSSSSSSASSSMAKMKPIARCLDKKEVSQPDASRSTNIEKRVIKAGALEEHPNCKSSHNIDTPYTNSSLSIKSDGFWTFGAKAMPLPPISRQTPPRAIQDSTPYTDVPSNEYVWSNLWHSGMPERSWRIWGPCINTGLVPASWNETFAKDLPTLHLYNALGSRSMKPDHHYEEETTPAERKPICRYKKQEMTRVGSRSIISSDRETKVPDLYVKQLTLEPGRNQTVEPGSRSKMGFFSTESKFGTLTTNYFIRSDTDPETPSYTNPRIGASSEFLARLNELLTLEESTKRWERIKWRRRMKKRAPQNGVVVASGDT